ncbi:hypothetical protein [Spiroplasma endosymbiont of Agriotes lineatus]|uniref:hypothetical protein n=1 Tax=Spiroplasma endosymbiont of Agriotes lineatus TaxID=3077930 RepID=UPI0030D32BBC
MSKNKTNNTELINKEELLQQAALQTIIKEYGSDAVVDMNNKLPSKDNVISSGSLLLDNAIGIGGCYRGRVIEVYGAESSGKTTLALHAISEVQKGNEW